jgi:hypothetical protein
MTSYQTIEDGAEPKATSPLIDPESETDGAQPPRVSGRVKIVVLALVALGALAGLVSSTSSGLPASQLAASSTASPGLPTSQLDFPNTNEAVCVEEGEGLQSTIPLTGDYRYDDADRNGKDSKCGCEDTHTTQIFTRNEIENHAEGTGSGVNGWNNGCGGTGQEFLVPALGYVFPDEFQACCTVHDIDYGDCSKSKKEADERFKNCLFEVCKDPKFEGPAKNLWCNSRAAVGWLAVWKTGPEFFDNKQGSNCQCAAALPDVTYSIRGGHNNKYCANEQDAGIKCNRDSNGGDWEHYQFEALDNGQYAIKSRGKYCADDGDKGILCNRDGIGAWEKFDLVKLNNNNEYALRGYHNSEGKYCADEKEKIICNRDGKGDWETMQIQAI